LAQLLRRDTAQPCVVLGGDTRASTPTLLSWIGETLATGGVATRSAGVVPTPAVAHLVRATGATAGIAVSASHNPAGDNGIKLFDGNGFKWSKEHEAGLEERLRTDSDPDPESPQTPPPAPDPELLASYLDHLLSTLDGQSTLAGLSVAVDAANGAASPVARELFERAGANVTVAHDRPDGSNINVACGSTHPETIVGLAREARADLGVSLDGDADRCLLVDEKGSLLDGDAILYLWARALLKAGDLDGRAIVVTTMSNLGLELSLRRHGIDVVRCDVGDREVVTTMREHSLVLGGEQSGHLIHLGLSTTGDGLLSALQTSLLVARSDTPLSELARGLTVFPQTLVNVPVARKPPFETVPELAPLLTSVETRLGDEGRVLLRYSGTEPLARVMIEGPDNTTIEDLAAEIAHLLRAELA
jgi:phosphoglucosamine mutase